MAQTIIEILSDEHRRISELFSAIEEHPGRREELFDDLRLALLEHSRSEEAVLYPQLEGLRDLQVMVGDARGDHETVKYLLNELEAEGFDSSDWQSSFVTLKQSVHQHVQFEEAQIFDKLRQYFLKEELRLMGYKYLRTEGRVRQVESVKGMVRHFGKKFRGQLEGLFKK